MQIEAPDAEVWRGPRPALTRQLVDAVGRLHPDQRARATGDIERVTAMTDDAGQTALMAFAAGAIDLGVLPSAHARSVVVFLERQDLFRRAEEQRYADDRRGGRLWTGFQCDPDRVVLQDAVAVAAFSEAIAARLASPHIHVEVFERRGSMLEDDLPRATQVTIYREGPPDDEDRFVEGVLTRVPRRPVLEAAVIYDPASGVTEVVSNRREDRNVIAQAFTERLLGSLFLNERVIPPLYELAPLMTQHAFPRRAEDGIEDVKLVMLKLVPLDTAGQRLTLECARREKDDIWTMARTRLGRLNPLAGGWVIKQAKLVVQFRPEIGMREGRVLPITIVAPHRCDLRDRDPQESMIARRYLKEWGLLVDQVRTTKPRRRGGKSSTTVARAA